jgi:hypothetical protein
MEETVVRVPAVCPECGHEWLREFSAGRLAEALGTGGSILLYAHCHERIWAAGETEREQLREYLEVMSQS